MPTAEFDMPAGKRHVVTAPQTPFPEQGLPEDQVLAGVRDWLSRNRYDVPRNFGITYSGIPAPITAKVEDMTRGTFFVEWAEDQQAGTIGMEREAVRMMASLLGDPNAAGFITTGGTESNLAAMRLARDLGKRSEPEIVAPVTMHFSFRLGAELMGIRLREVDVDDRTHRPRIEDVERAITANTVALICSAPGGNFGLLDPVEEFAELAYRTGLYLHVDAAFGGFILPFMRDLGYDIPPFDFSLPGVSSMMTDGHKLGMLPVATGVFLAREARLFDSIPTESTLIHTTSSTKPGSRAASAWALMKHWGREGYRRSTAHVLAVTKIIADGVDAIPGIDLFFPPFIQIVGITSQSVNLEDVHELLADEGWGQSFGRVRGRQYIRLSIHPSRTEENAHGFVRAFEAAVLKARRI
ncbi:MAG TPA: aminotransferase class V-fold PLP-dependent enzyme [Candidatus Saccharimonadales bacterium]|nr:aminotransferase class V-fold PLP-dependent enzyme [Candidatus Saccharimonadales bacterium]